MLTQGEGATGGALLAWREAPRVEEGDRATPSRGHPPLPPELSDTPHPEACLFLDQESAWGLV